MAWHDCQLSICPCALCMQLRQEVEVQLASQLRKVEAQRRRASREAAKLGQQVQQQAAQVQHVAQRKAQVAAHK